MVASKAVTFIDTPTASFGSVHAPLVPCTSKVRVSFRLADWEKVRLPSERLLRALVASVAVLARYQEQAEAYYRRALDIPLEEGRANTLNHLGWHVSWSKPREAERLFSIPFVPSLVGITFFSQWLAADPSHGFGWSFSNGVSITIQP